MSVNADKLVQIVPRVIDAGTSGLTFSGLFLTKSKLPPTGRVLQFSSAQGVVDYFGSETDEARAAQIYFQGYTNTQYLPGYMLFAPYRETAAAAWLRGAAYEGSLADLVQVKSGTLEIDIDGVACVATEIDLRTATSLSDCAQLLQTALSQAEGATELEEPPLVTYDSQTRAFQITSGKTNSSSSVGFGKEVLGVGTDLSLVLNLTEQLGAVQSEGTDGQKLADCMTGVLKSARDWVSFSTIWEPEYDEKLELATWCSGHDTRFVYVLWDTDNAARVQGSVDSVGYAINTTLELDGTCCVWNTLDVAAGVMGAIACLNFDQNNGRTTLAFRQFEGVTVTCDNDNDYEALIANGYNCYADFATASAQFKFLQNGQVSGKFDWLDTYCNAIALKDALQLNILDLFAAVRSLPYNEDGYASVRTACLDTINRFVTFGAIRAGVTLSQTQKVQLLQEIGKDVSQTLESTGWFMQISDPGAVVRGERKSPNCAFYYMDGGSIQKIVMSATAIQ